MELMNKSAIDPKSVELADFLSVWHGPPNPAPDRNDPRFSWVPDGLRKCHELSAIWGVPTEGVKRLLSLSELAEEEGKYIFLGDQGGWAWAFDRGTPGAVFEAKDDEPWRRLPGGWEEFTFHHVFTETIEAAPFVYWSSDISQEGARSILDEKFREVAFRQSAWPAAGWRSYMAEDMLADVGPVTPGRIAMTIGAKSGGLVENLKSLTGADWRVREN